MLSCQGISPEGKSVEVSGENGSAGLPIRIKSDRIPLCDFRGKIP